ncbi:MAG: TonB-dependent receptor [Acidobacteria bacterium]|nr:TonB-dependent receptor [Acidobacteriota bacterium]
MRKLLTATLALCLLAASASAQGSSTGRLVGTVSSPDGVIAGATATVTSNQTGAARTVVTSGDGTYTVPQLEIGTYTVKISAPGFKSYTATELKIDTGREYSLDATLKAGDINETVTVTAGADTVNTTNAELSNTVTERQIVELPLANRDALALIQLQPGISSNGAQNTSINGQRPSMTNLTRDGINIQDNFIRQNTVDFSPTRPGADDVAEFTVTSQNAGADRGYGSSQVNAVTPRGSNQYHGALWAYNRNSEFAANNFFNNANRVARPYLNRNQFGGKVGGPMPLPRFGEGGPSLWRDKAFFFGTWERLLTRSSSSRTRTILLPDARQGLFTYRDNPGVVRQINLLNPALGTGITAINPLIQSRFIANTPEAGNTTVAGDQLNTTGFRFNQAANNDRDAMTLRFDVDANSRHSLNFVFNRNDEFTLRPDQEGNLGFGISPVVSDAAVTNLYVAVWRFTPSANFTNEVRGGWLDSFPTFSRNAAAPSQFFTLTSISNPEVAFLPQGRDTNTYNFQDNAEYLRGNHSFRFGFQGQLFRVNRLNDAGIVPTLTLGTNANTPQIGTAQFTNAALFPGGISTTQRTAANNLLALLGGIVSTATQTFNVTAPGSGFVPGAGLSQNYEHENYSFYFNDQWRLRPNLSLNLGLRYEMFTGLRETNGVILEPNIPAGSTVEQALLNPSGFTQIAGTNLGGDKVFNNDFDNFGPVVSLAYTPNFKNKFLNGIFPDGGRTVIRGGYRRSFVNDTILRASASEGDANSGLRGANTLTNLNLRAGDSITVPQPSLAIPRSYALNNSLGGLLGTIGGIDPDIQIPSTHEFNIGIQRELGFQTALELRYVHGRSNQLWRYIDLNQLDINNNGFLGDFLRAQQNLSLVEARRAQIQASGLSGAALTAALAPFPVSIGFNANLSGSQQLPVLATLTNAGGTAFTNASVVQFVREGRPGSLAQNYVTLGLTNGFAFFPNRNAGVARLLCNCSEYSYNAMQFEVRKRFSQGLYFQANYTWQKTLTDSSGSDQSRIDPRIDNSRPRIEYGRADFDVAHVFNFNGIYELPFGKGKPFLNEGSWLNRLVSGWQVTGIMTLQSGAPFTPLDPRSTFNRTTPSANQTAFSTMSREELRSLFGVRRLPDGRVLFVDPSVLAPSGAATGGAGSPAFGGQALFNVPAGQVGNIERGLINGPSFFNIDASMIKNISITERTRLQLRAEAFNLLNHTNFFIGNTDDINSTTFGVIGSAFTARRLQFAARFEF